MAPSYSTYYARERSPYSLDDSRWSHALIRRDTKRRSYNFYDDDEHDDYPYAHKSKPAKLTRAITIRRPSQAESKNIWSYHSSYGDSPRDFEESYDRNYKYSSTRHVSRTADESANDDDDDDEKNNAYGIKFKATATFRRPSSSKSERPEFWPGDLFKRKEKWQVTDWEHKQRERARRDSFFDDEPRMESTTRYRQLKRTKTEEFKPLIGFGRRW